jgi:hypothetical protein
MTEKIIPKVPEAHAIARIRWYTPDEGGRSALPSGPVYAANARFEGISGLWSVVLLLPPGSHCDKDDFQNIELGFLFREKLDEHLQGGRKIFISEGPVRVVAEGQIISVLA